MKTQLLNHLSEEIARLRQDGLYKAERQITTPQDTHISVASGQSVLNLCANNYLGLAQHPDVAKAARKGIDDWGYRLASVHFICGTQSIHKELEEKLSEFLGTEDTILLFPLASMPMLGDYSRFAGTKTPSSPTSSIRQHHRRDPPLLEPRDSDTQWEWPISRSNCRRPPIHATGSSPPTASSAWTVRGETSPPSVTWPSATTQW